jgi:hypothetical protein
MKIVIVNNINMIIPIVGASTIFLVLVFEGTHNYLTNVVSVPTGISIPYPSIKIPVIKNKNAVATVNMILELSFALNDNTAKKQENTISANIII